MDFLLAGLMGQAAVVTGAASGISRRVALMLAQAGVNLALIDVNAEGLAALADEAAASGRIVHAIPADLGKRPS